MPSLSFSFSLGNRTSPLMKTSRSRGIVHPTENERKSGINVGSVGNGHIDFLQIIVRAR